MKKSRITIIALFVGLGILLLLYFIFWDSDKKHFQWNESYKAESDQPYGTLFVRQLLESYHPGGKFVYNKNKSLHNVLDDSDLQKETAYIFIGQSLLFDYRDTDALLAFVNGGNDAFISTLDLPKDFVDAIHKYECGEDLEYDHDDKLSVTMNFYHDTLLHNNGYEYTYRYRTEDLSYYWSAFKPGLFCDSTQSVTALGYYDSGFVNFIRIPYGEGNVYLHTNPLVFTNYFMLKEDKAEYAASVFSHLRGKNIVWDEYSKVPFLGNNNAFESPLYYILQQPSLKYAWWLLLVTILLYILFVTKRTQRVIPVLEVKTNTSLEYIKLISSLHFQNGNHVDMARKKMRYFLYFVRSKYGIQGQPFSEFHIRKLAEKSKVSQAEIEVIFNQYNLIEKNASALYNIEANRLADFYNSIENFYKHCK